MCDLYGDFEALAPSVLLIQFCDLQYGNATFRIQQNSGHDPHHVNWGGRNSPVFILDVCSPILGGNSFGSLVSKGTVVEFL